MIFAFNKQAIEIVWLNRDHRMSAAEGMSALTSRTVERTAATQISFKLATIPRRDGSWRSNAGKG